MKQNLPLGRIVAAVVLMTAFPLTGMSGMLPVAAAEGTVSWKDAMKQEPGWYKSAEASRIADNLLLYQHDNGGWNKNIDMAQPLDASARAKLEKESHVNEATIDNGATHTQLAYLARVYDATKTPKYRVAWEKGIDYLLQAQYPNGGWPQYYPLRKGYYTHITFNDDAMASVLTLLRDVANKQAPYAWVDAGRRAKAATAVQKGTDCILKTQIVQNNKRTVWCQQHDEKTLAPAPARKFEPAAFCSAESVGIVRFLLGVPNPTPDVRAAIDGAVSWLAAHRLTGIRTVRKPMAGANKGYDVVVEADPSAPPTWARMYELSSGRPIFVGRDAIIKYRLADIEQERRSGYAWYTDRPQSLIERDYPKWQKKWGR